MLAAGCLPSWSIFPKTTPPPATQPAAQPAQPPQYAEPVLTGALDMGGGYAGDLDGTRQGYALSSHLGTELGAACGFRLGRNAVMLRGLLDMAGENPDKKGGVLGGGVGPSLLTWRTLPVVDLPVEIEVGLGVGAFSRAGESTHSGLDVFAAFGVPLVHDRTLLLSLRMSDLHSASDPTSVMLPPFGDQQLMTFTLGLSWRGSST